MVYIDSMDKLKTILTNLYYKIDAMYYEISGLDCEMFVSEEREEQIKEILLLYGQFKQELPVMFQIELDNIAINTINDPVTLLSPIIEAWILVQIIDEQLFNDAINMDTLKEFDSVMEQLRMVSVGWLV